MPLDCNDVENCLSTSAIIAAINATLTSLQSQISSNDTDISQNAADIALNQLDIATLASDIDDLQLSIFQHQLTLNYFDQRITNLENAQGGVPNLQTRTIRIPVLLGQDIALTDVDDMSLNWENTDDYDIIHVDFYGISDQATATPLLMYLNADETDANYQSQRQRSFGTTTDAAAPVRPDVGVLPANGAVTPGGYAPIVIDIYHSQGYGRAQIQAKALYRNGDTGNVVKNDHAVYWENTDDITSVKFVPLAGKIKAGSYFVAYGMRFLEVALPADPDIVVPQAAKVTFGDIPDWPNYTISNSTVNGDVATSGGNPGYCWFVDGALSAGNGVDIFIDFLSDKNIIGFKFDYSSDYTGQIDAYLFSGESIVTTVNRGGAQLTDKDGIYHTFDLFAAVAPGALNNRIAQLKISFSAETTGFFFLDNVIVEYED